MITLWIPKDVSCPRGQIVTIPVNVSNLAADPDNGNVGGMQGGNFVVKFDQSILTVVRVRAGSIPQAYLGWYIEQTNPMQDYLLVLLPNRDGGIVDDQGEGSLIEIDFLVAAEAPLGQTPLNLCKDYENGDPVTSVTDFEGTAYTMSPAPTNGMSKVDGLINVVS